MLNRAPEVLAVGDLHIASFGTWRDGFGRLIWGIDDFDEAYPLPYTNDLVRLAVSAVLDASEGEITVSLRNATEVILEGYRAGLKAGGEPFVLEEKTQVATEDRTRLPGHTGGVSGENGCPVPNSKGCSC